MEFSSEYIIYVDESGDHSLSMIDPLYPVFVLVFCIFRKVDYAQIIEPLFKELKFRFFGHDLTILHTREIRKSQNDFSILLNENIRLEFFDQLNQIMEQIPLTIVASVIDKQELKAGDSQFSDPYHLALRFCLEKTMLLFQDEEQGNRPAFVILEERGKNEDRQLRSVFYEIADGENSLGMKIPMQIRFANKQTNIIGLQIADLVAHPIGRHIMNPNQNNRSYEILKRKLWKWPKEELSIGIYPKKRKTLVTTKVLTPTGHSQST
ncbi:MAG TPA: DUF3800 domain-containing protein [Rhabdochlamydiaceae bacterium]|nr:DUF3800 domain-containing protein [Rhabdochlamydiaceae bacterium]